MRIILESEDELVVHPTDDPVTIEARSPDLSYSAFHMLASGFGTCVLSVLYTWAASAELPTEHLAVRIKWSFAEEPHRVGRYELKIHWPDLPADRVAAAQRVAGLCAVHETLTHPPEIDVQIEQLPAGSLR